MKRIELLAPAGDFNSLKAAINNGADAVYLGGKSFSARAFAENFNREEIVEAIMYAHLRFVKIYITINTLFNEYEIENAYNECKFYYENNVDGLLIQDLGLYYRLRNDFKDLELHASTQMHIHNLSGVKTAKELGFNRIVLARESSLDLIKECCKEDIEIECFVHGAICASYSGQCLISSFSKNRSGNKGLCSQSCRLKYSLYENSKKIKTDTDYLLSTKDMCLINEVPLLIEAGVSSLKIEGRMKSPAYVGYVTRIYRKAIDAYYENKEYKIDKETLSNLKELYNRDFTNTYLLDDDKDLFSNYRPNHMCVEIGKVISYNYPKCKVKLTKSVNQFDGIRIISNEDTGLILNKLYIDDRLVSKGNIDDVIEFDIKDKVYPNDVVVRTYNHELEESILDTKDKKIDIDLVVSIEHDDFIRVKCFICNKVFEYLSDVKAELAKNYPLTEANIIDCFNNVDAHPYKVKSIVSNIDNSYVYLKILNDVRRDFYNNLDLYILNSFKRNTNKTLNYINKNIVTTKQEDTISFDDITCLNPVINPESKYNSDYNFVSEFGGLLLGTKKDAFYTLNVSNSFAYEFLLRLGFNIVVLSSELNENDAKLIVEHFMDRCGIELYPYMIHNYNRPLMYIKRDPFKNYINNKEKLSINDGNLTFDIKYMDNHIEILEKSYNKTPFIKLIK